MNTTTAARRAAALVASVLSLGLTAGLAEAAEPTPNTAPTASSTVSWPTYPGLGASFDAWYRYYLGFGDSKATAASRAAYYSHESIPAEVAAEIAAEAQAYADAQAKAKADAEAKAEAEAAAKAKAAAAAKAKAAAAAAAKATAALPKVRVTGGTKAQRARVLRLAKAALAPRGTVIRITANRSWGTSFPGSAANGRGTLIKIQPQVVRGGGARLRYVVTHEVMHARQFKAAHQSWNRMWINAGAARYNGSNAKVDCQADRMTALAGVPLVSGSYLSRGYGRYCTTAAAKKVLAASR